MAFDKIQYINNYNANNYKMYQFRVRRDSDLISFLDNTKNRNTYIVSLIEENKNPKILKLKDIKRIIMPILSSHGIHEVYLFGSYARGDASADSDVDIFCEKGSIRTLPEQGQLEDELSEKLCKKVDLVFTGSTMSEFFYNQLKEDLIKFC